MKPKHLFTSLLGVTALLVASCSTPKLAQNSAVDDDVYGTVAKAKEYKQADPVQRTQADNSDNSAYTTSDPYYDMDYASRIDRFYYGSPYRNYYDPYYNYYGYNSWYGYGPYFGFSLGGYFNNFYNNWYNPYSYYGWGNPYYGGWWGPYSYYGGYWGGGYWGGGYYGGGYYSGRGSYNNPNYGARPSRGSENGVGRANSRGSYYGGGASSGIPSRANNGNNNGTTVTRSRAEMYNPATNGTTRPNGTSSTNDNRPTRGGSTTDSRPTRSEAPPSRPQPTYNPPPQQSSPPPSSGGGGGRSGGGSSGGGGGGGGRPTRGGR